MKKKHSEVNEKVFEGNIIYQKLHLIEYVWLDAQMHVCVPWGDVCTQAMTCMETKQHRRVTPNLLPCRSRGLTRSSGLASSVCTHRAISPAVRNQKIKVSLSVTTEISNFAHTLESWKTFLFVFFPYYFTQRSTVLSHLMYFIISFVNEHS